MIRNSLVILLIAVVFMGCASLPSRPSLPEHLDVDLASSQEVVLTVYGLSCPLCSHNLDGQLRRIEGVEDAVINLKTGAVSVRLRQGHSISSNDLAAAVENAGFTLREIQPTVVQE